MYKSYIIVPKTCKGSLKRTFVEFAERSKNKVKLALEKLTGITMSEKEIQECCVSLYYLGKARVRFSMLQHERNKKKNSCAD